MVAALYGLSGVLFMPSTEEGFGLPLLEAGVFKLPVLCSNIPPFQEIGGGNVEFFTEDESPEKLAGRLLGLCEGVKSGRMFRTVLKNYRWDRIFGNLIEPLVLDLWRERQ
jgi:glycosyltransferase involved in cell wall biosynthesis